MIDWWIIPTLVSILAVFFVIATLLARDMAQFMAAVSFAILSGLGAIGLWVLCLILKVICS